MSAHDRLLRICGPVPPPELVAELDAHCVEVRAETLREAADALDESKTLRDLTDDHMHDVNAAANELRRMADETAPAAPNYDYAAKALYEAARCLDDIPSATPPGRYREGIAGAAALLRTWADQCRFRAPATPPPADRRIPLPGIPECPAACACRTTEEPPR